MDSKGRVLIAPSVIKQIILETLKDIEGVIGITKANKNGLFKSNDTKELEVEMTDSECVIDLSVTLEYGAKLNEIADNIQSEIIKQVENLSGIRVKEVNVNITAISKVNVDKEKGEKNV